MLLPADYSGDTVQVYMSFVSADGKMTSSSKFLGTAALLQQGSTKDYEAVRTAS